MDARIKARRCDGIHEIPALNDVDAGYFENIILTLYVTFIIKTII